MKPTKEFRNGLTKAAVFQGTAKGNRGEYTSEAVSLQISHVKDGEFINRNITILRKDLPRVQAVLSECENYFSEEASK